MNTLIKAFTIATFLFAATASWAAPLSAYPQVTDTLNDDTLVLYTYWACLDEGHELAETDVQPIYYFVAPEGEHKFADVTLVMQKETAEGTETVTIRIEVLDDGFGTLKCDDMQIERETVVE